jgi:DNA polymerase III subunit alpha
VRGRADLRGRELQLRALEIAEPDLGAARRTRPSGTLVVDVAAASCTNAVIAKLKELLGAHSGSAPVQVRFLSSQGVTPLDVGTFRVNPGAGLLSELRLLLGKDAAKVVARGDEDTVRVPDVAAATR